MADTSRHSPHFAGKVRSNFLGTEFVLYDTGDKPGKQRGGQRKSLLTLRKTPAVRLLPLLRAFGSACMMVYQQLTHCAQPAACAAAKGPPWRASRTCRPSASVSAAAHHCFSMLRVMSDQQHLPWPEVPVHTFHLVHIINCGSCGEYHAAVVSTLQPLSLLPLSMPPAGCQSDCGHSPSACQCPCCRGRPAEGTRRRPL